MDDDYYIINVDNQEEKIGTIDDECEKEEKEFMIVIESIINYYMKVILRVYEFLYESTKNRDE